MLKFDSKPYNLQNYKNNRCHEGAACNFGVSINLLFNSALDKQRGLIVWMGLGVTHLPTRWQPKRLFNNGRENNETGAVGGR
jgi:hypothetical protein